MPNLKDGISKFHLFLLIPCFKSEHSTCQTVLKLGFTVRELGFAVLKLGFTVSEQEIQPKSLSFDIQSAIFIDGLKKPAALSLVICVCYDYENGKSVTVYDEIRNDFLSK